GMRHGIRNRLQPDAEASSYSSGDHGVLPPDWRSAIERAAGSEFIKDALGERLAAVFVALKRAEHLRFAAEVTAEEFAYYGGVI
ncbi:MAG TPA: hypothetical protein VIQ53_15555, partial [Inquilinus sp.]